MKISNIYWPKKKEKCYEIQRENMKNLDLHFKKQKINIIGGLDLSFPKKNIALAILVILSYKNLELLNVFFHISRNVFPYISGLLSFREGPIIIELLKKFRGNIDVFFVDGQGVAHPRYFGLASHIGTIIEKPTIGVAKSHLYGDFNNPEAYKGSFEKITKSNNILGYVLRSKEKCNPIFVSPGNYIDSKKSLELVKNTITKYRLPEPTRLAHKYSQFYKKKLFVSKIYY